nr:PAS domain S-box protein [uncultured Desulfobacter sp.]
MYSNAFLSDLEKSLSAYKHIEKEQLMILDALESVNEIDTLEGLIPAILTWMKKWSECDAVGIRLQDGDDYPYYTTSGFPERFVELERHLCAYDEDGSLIRDDDGRPMIECMCGNVIRGRFDPSKNFFTSDGTFWTNCTTRLLSETTDADRLARGRHRCSGFGYDSVALIPLRSGGHTFGLMQFNDLEAGKFSAKTVAAFRRVADQVASALAKLKAVDSLKKTEEKLRRQKFFLEKAQEIGKIGSWELDLERDILFWTDENYKIFGVPKDTDLTYELFLACVHPDDREFVENAWKAALSGAFYDIEHRIRADGIVKWVREKARLEFDDHGKCIRAIGVTQDITERKFTENALKASEERFKFLSEATVEGICIHDNGVVLDANKSFAKILGYDSVDKIIGSKLTTKHLTSESLKKAQTSIDSGYQGAYEAVGIRCDGTRAPVEFITKNISYRGKPVRVVAARDISAHKAAEELLTWNVKRNKILSETAACLLQSVDPQSLINELCKKVMAFLDCQVFFNFLEDPDSGKLHLNACAGISDEKRREIEWLDHETAVCGTVARTGRCMICEDIANCFDPVTELVKSFGIQAYCCHPLVIEDRLLGTLAFGKRIGSRFLPEDIEMMKSIASLVAVAVNRIKTEKEKINLETQLRQAQKVEAIGRLAGGIAHDLNNMLCPILNYAEILAEDLRVGDPRRDQALEIANAGVRARDMVRQLLAFSRKQVIELKPIDINLVVQGIEKLLLRTIPEDIKFKKNLSGKILPVLADIGQIEQILMNLTVNSADAMPDGGLLLIETGLSHLDEVYAGNHPDVRPGLYVMLSVSDTGSGMDKDTLEHIFEPFFSTKGEQGTGLGLATVYGIVKQHNGNIWMYSEPGVGTTCKIYLPIAKEMPEEKKPGQKTKESQTGKETILLVEDNELVRHLGRIILERWGYTVLEAENGNDALDIMASCDDVIHLLLTDVVMPGMDGKALYEKAVQKYQGLKVLYMSGYTDDIIAHRGVLSEGIQLVQKPFSVNGLAAKVREVLDS